MTMATKMNMKGTKMTKRRPTHKHTSLKVLLTTGAFMASLAGTRVLAARDAAAGLLNDTTETPAAVVVLPPATTVELLPAAPGGVTVQLAPVPRAVAPRPRVVARSRSSR